LLNHEADGIYRALLIAESRCLEEDHRFRNYKESSGKLHVLQPAQWQALIMLHRAFINEVHDYLLATSHPLASKELRLRARSENIPARLWKVGIHSFLEILRHRLPEAQEWMLSFIIMVYGNITLLLETIPEHRDTWLECLGDLARFRMAIEEANFRDREIYSGLAKWWYSISADHNPSVGRLQHHLGILARPNLLAQLYFYAKSLTVGEPFLNARSSIKTLFEPAIQGSVFNHPYFEKCEIDFITIHGRLFLEVDIDGLDTKIENFIVMFKDSLPIIGQRMLERSAYYVVANAAALLGYGSPSSFFDTNFKDVRPSFYLQ
jgi:hypothetical protein